MSSWLTSKFMLSVPGYDTTCFHTLTRVFESSAGRNHWMMKEHTQKMRAARNVPPFWVLTALVSPRSPGKTFKTTKNWQDILNSTIYLQTNQSGTFTLRSPPHSPMIRRCCSAVASGRRKWMVTDGWENYPWVGDHGI